MNKFFKYLVSIWVFSLMGCSLDWDKVTDPNLPYWSTMLEFPLFTTEVTLESLAEDSLISIEGLDLYYSDGTIGDSIFVFHTEIEIETVEVGDQLKIDPFSTSFSQEVDDVKIDPFSTNFSQEVDDVKVAAVSKNISSEVGTITLDDIIPNPTDPFVFKDIYPSVNSIDDGDESIIPEFPLDIVNPFNFNDFDYAIFSGGQLNIEIQNDMVIDLGKPITIQLQEIDGGDTNDIPDAMVEFDYVIPKESIASELLDLDGITLPGSIIINVYGRSQGTNGEKIIIDADAKNSSFQVFIGGSSLLVESTNAKIPEQIIEEEGNITLEPDSNKVTEATIKSGNLIIEVDNYMALESKLKILIPSIQSASGNEFETELNISSNTENIGIQTDMTGNILVMDPDNQMINYVYNVTTIDSRNDQDLTTDMVLINAEDSIVVSIKLEGSIPGTDITFSNFRGYLDQDAMVDANNIELDNDAKVDQATLKSGKMILKITNEIGVSADVDFTIEEFIFNGSALNESFALSTDPEPQNIIIDLSGYVMDLDAEEDPQNVHYVSTINIPSDEEVSLIFGKSIATQVLIDSLSFQEFSGYLDQEAMVNSSSIELDNDTKVDQATLKSGKMILKITNRIGIKANVDFIIEEFIYNGSSLDTSFALSTEPEPLSIIIDLSGYVLDLDAKEDPQNVHYVSTINIPSDEKVSLTFGQSIEIDVSIDSLSFQEVSGYIDPVIVDIDPVIEDIALPEQLEDIEFDKVEIKLDFKSNISIPVYLDLRLVSFNDETGDSIVKTIERHNITNESIVYIDSAQHLINILPNRITASGRAEVGDPNELGSVTTSDTLSGILTVAAPLSFIINDSSIISADPQKMDPIEADQIKNAQLFLNYQNEFEFGADLMVLLAQDTTYFESDMADTLITLLLEANVTGMDSLLLDESKFNLLTREENYSKTIISLLGQGDGVPSRFLSTDTLTVKLSAAFKYLINDPNSTETPTVE